MKAVKTKPRGVRTSVLYMDEWWWLNKKLQKLVGGLPLRERDNYVTRVGLCRSRVATHGKHIERQGT